jgi:hypothetical protein
MATDRATLARSRFRTAVRRKSWSSRPGTPAFSHAVSQRFENPRRACPARRPLRWGNSAGTMRPSLRAGRRRESLCPHPSCFAPRIPLGCPRDHLRRRPHRQARRCQWANLLVGATSSRHGVADRDQGGCSGLWSPLADVHLSTLPVELGLSDIATIGEHARARQAGAEHWRNEGHRGNLYRTRVPTRTSGLNCMPIL